jgi:hypothetical protein
METTSARLFCTGDVTNLLPLIFLQVFVQLFLREISNYFGFLGVFVVIENVFDAFFLDWVYPPGTQFLVDPSSLRISHSVV